MIAHVNESSVEVNSAVISEESANAIARLQTDHWATESLESVMDYLVDQSIRWSTDTDERLAVLDKIERIHSIKKLLSTLSNK
ncbi:MAG: hypothetical protein ACRC5A_07925 [Enterobacteriaceae bacterium]